MILLVLFTSTRDQSRCPRGRHTVRWNQASVGLDEESHEQARRVEAHHNGSVQPSVQVAGHVEHEDFIA